jgi:cytochrome c oxidase subunit 2
MVVLMSRSAALAVALLVPLVATVPAQQPTPRVIEITAERFDFWPSEITVTEGEELELRITSDDTAHGFRLVGTSINVMIPKRGKGQAVVRLRAPQAGRYTFECSRMCGAGHNFMRSVLVVKPSSARSLR